MNNTLKSILNAVPIVWVIILYLNLGRSPRPIEDVLPVWQLSPDRSQFTAIAKPLHNQS